MSRIFEKSGTYKGAFIIAPVFTVIRLVLSCVFMRISEKSEKVSEVGRK